MPPSRTAEMYGSGRIFSQDDSHIYCPIDRIGEEIAAFVDFLDDVYRTFDFLALRIVNNIIQQADIDDIAFFQVNHFLRDG